MNFVKKIFYVVVVIYNKFCKNSLTLKCLEKISGLGIVICDNSTISYKNSEYSRSRGYCYLDMQGNKGLAVAYNSAVELLKDKDGFVCLFDDDTFVSSDYFSKLKEAILNSNADIYLPVICDSTGILSPSKINGVFVKRVKNIKILHQKNITGINSAMAISLKIFKEGYRYDENYFLDCIDHNFLRDMKRLNKKIGIINVKLMQNFSGSTFVSKEANLKRFRIYKRDFREFCKGNFFDEFCAFFVIIKRLLNLTIKFRTLDFLLKK